MTLTLASSALALGFVHGLGADHLMAIAALAVHRRDRRDAPILQTAVGFAVGHTAVLGVAVAVALGLGFVLPAAFAVGAERLGGLLLVALGVLAGWSVTTGRTYGHEHPRSDGRTRWHFHFGLTARHSHVHSRVPTVLGAVFAMSSVRALMLLEPLGVSAEALSWPVVLLLVMLFGVGILVSMALFGVILARVLSLRTVEALGRAAAGLVAVASILLGVYWILA
jgi:hypothetical protein